ncbi:transporter substrate-binding domain-containing protein [Sphaerotilus sp.]|uniref:transporter substrate-binding domain-containing protein n=1 Tax=Sphaerotilus sp. TaxID=2093942 RepID=UPI00286DEE0D|nr:transporter substrate-binding domain-containing protein [Sphaerotilus sp.]
MRWHLMAWSALVVGVAAAALTLVARTSPDVNTDGGDGMVLRAGYALEAPYAYRDAQGVLQGEAVDTLRAALQRAGLPEPVWVHVEFPRLIHELQSGRIDVIAAGMFITPERASQVEFTRPTTSVRAGLLVPKGNPLGLHALEDLRRPGRAPLAVLDGSVELAQARVAGLTDAQLLRLPDPASALAALRSGQAAAFALSAPSLRWAVRESPTLDMATPLSIPLRDGQPDIGYPAFVFRPGDPRRARLDQALSSYLGSAEHVRSVARYGFSADDIAAAHGMDPASRIRGARP